MASLSYVKMINPGFIAHAFLTVVVYLIYKIVKYLTGEARKLPANSVSNRRRLGLNEEIIDILSTEKSGSTNICLAISITSKQSLLHQHVRDALVLLAKRQPMLRAVITAMANGDKCFEVKEISEVITMLDVATSDVKASDWQDVWFEYTAKQKGNGLLWRVVILQEQFILDTKDYVNTLMFNFHHSCIDGVSAVKFCKQFLIYMNELANGSSFAEQDIPSLNLLSYYHDIVTRGRNWHSLYDSMLAYCGLRPILKYCMKRVFARLIEKKPNNPYLEQFPPKPEVFNSPLLNRPTANIKVYSVKETGNIIQACRANNCTVTGAITAVAHLAFCQILDDDRSKDITLEHLFSVNGQRYCDPKPHEDFLGLFVYTHQDFYMKYQTGAAVDFWKLAQETTERIKDFVKNEQYVAELTVISGLMKPRELIDLFFNDTLFSKSGCNLISSFGSFNFGEQQPETYKLHECVVNNLPHGMNCTFFHFNYTINGKMTWQIASNVTVDSNHAVKFAHLCFEKLIEISRN